MVLYIDQAQDQLQNVPLDRQLNSNEPGIYIGNGTTYLIKERVQLKRKEYSHSYMYFNITFSRPIQNDIFFTLNQTRISYQKSTSNNSFLLSLPHRIHTNVSLQVSGCRDADAPFGECQDKEIEITPPLPIRMTQALMFRNQTLQLTFSRPVYIVQIKLQKIIDLQICINWNHPFLCANTLYYGWKSIQLDSVPSHEPMMSFNLLYHSSASETDIFFAEWTIADADAQQETFYFESYLYIQGKLSRFI